MLRQVKAKCALEGRTMRSLALVFFDDWLRDGAATATLLGAPSAAEESPGLATSEPGSGEAPRAKRKSIRDLPMIGMWKDREDMADPAAWVRNLRKPRFTI